MAAVLAAAQSLERLESLHRDLFSLTESRLPEIERLLGELDSVIDECRSLLDKRPRNDQSRKAVSSGTITLEDEEFSLNEDFKQEVIKLSDLLDLDELDAAILYMHAQKDSPTLDRSPLVGAVILFHQRRHFLLECIRISFRLAIESEDDSASESNMPFQSFMELVTKPAKTDSSRQSEYYQRCLASMGNIESWLQQIVERLQTNAVTGQVLSSELVEMVQFQRQSLTKQHECLGAILYFLVKGQAVQLNDFRDLIAKLRHKDRYDLMLVHHLPALTSFISAFGPTDGACSFAEAKGQLHDFIVSTKDSDAWALRPLHAATISVWLAEFSGRYLDTSIGSEAPELNLEREAEQRSSLFAEALRDGAFHFLLCVSRDVTANDWVDPKRKEMTAFLTQDSPALQTDPFTVDQHFKETLMEQFQYFADLFITNMPDAIRKLRFDEDEQRRQLRGRVQLRPAEYDLHFERFLMIMSYAFGAIPAAADGFWSDPDGNLFGFLQWSSQRQSTPRAAAFCEMLRALSIGEANADAAHKFLLDDSPSTGGKLRKNSPLSWSVIFSELEFYSSNIRDKPNPQQDRTKAENLMEPESPMMLDSYLRLLGHLCNESNAARAWILTHPSFQIYEHLLLLCGGAIDSGLRACAFSALGSLLTNKNQEVGDGMWIAVDAWMFGHSPGANISRAPSIHSSTISFDRLIFDSISKSLAECNAFIELLRSLIAPNADDIELNDALPFPESLGAAYRMPGIEPYIDFVLGQVFANKTADLRDGTLAQIINWNCLNFTAACLATFNQDLVVFANKSTISVDSAIRTSSLTAYARLHPFARVMEWFFNEKVISALFETAVQDVSVLTASSPDSPLVLGVSRSVEVISLILSLQFTYFDIVRPIVKLQSASRRPVVANAAYASFEDAVLNHVSIIPMLGRYCGLGHEDLTRCSLMVLQKLSASRKLSAPVSGPGRWQSGKSVLVTAMERDDEVESISVPMVQAMQVDPRELEQGNSAPGYSIKRHILTFLNATMENAPNTPTIAQLILGFSCYGRSLGISDEGSISNNRSLLHAVIEYLNDCPNGLGDTLLSWLTVAKMEAMRVLQNLWMSPLSAKLVLPELRATDFLVAQWLQQPVVDHNTRWDGVNMQDSEFLIADCATAYVHFLTMRSAFLNYVATELRSIHKLGFASNKARIGSALLGVAILLDGQKVATPTIFDLYAFPDLDLSGMLPLPQTKFFNVQDLEMAKANQEGSISKYDTSIAKQLLLLKENELRKAGKLTAQGEEQQMTADAQNILLCLHANNQRLEIRKSVVGMLYAWAEAVEVMLECCDFDAVVKRSVIILTLQTVLPRLEVSFSEDMDTSVILANLLRSQFKHIDFALFTEGDHSTQSTGVDRLLRLFRICLTGIQHPDATTQLRDVCYLICYEYLQGITKLNDDERFGRSALQSVKSQGDRLVEALCDDILGGSGSCRISSLLFLCSLVSMANSQGSDFILESLVRMNFINVVVDGVRSLASEAQESESMDDSDVLPYYEAALSLLLRISQTRPGAAYVANAGFFAAVRDSGLFSADPDIGIEIDNPRALSKYFELLLAILRIVNALLLSRGSENAQAMTDTHQFLHEYRPCIVAVLKRDARIGTAGKENEDLLAELVNNVTVLISACGFLDSEDGTQLQRQSQQIFS